MAVLASSDWQLNTMDLNARQQRSSPANDPSSSPAPTNGHHHQLSNTHAQQPQPYPYPVQQQPQGSWTPSISAQPFYPSFYATQQPQPYPQLPQQPPYFDPANAQLAQWAYQQMMYNAQQGFMPQQQQQPPPPGRSSQNPAPNEYFAAQNQMNPMFNPFPSGTPPPPHPHRTPSVDQGQQPPNGGQYPPGFHPYRRPTGQRSAQSQSQSPSPPQSHAFPDNNDWRSGGVPNPPYARPDASGSSSSVNSAGSGRPRTDSNQSSRSNRDAPPNGNVRGRNSSSSSAPTPPSAGSSNRSSPSGSFSSSSSATRNPHHRNLSSSSTNSSSTGSRPAGLTPSPPTTSTSTSSTSSIPSSTPLPRPARPSPLSQGNFTAAEKRMSRDDSDLQAMLESTSSGTSGSRGGIKGRLRRALTFNAAQSLKEEEDDDDASIKASALGSSGKLKAKTPAVINSATSKSSSNGTTGMPSSESTADDAESTATIQTTTTKKRGRAASLFNSRLNASTDNISLSSTVSSASVMIRKLGSMGKLARRNSLAGITSLFKDKKNKEAAGEDEESISGKKKKKDKKSAKGEASEASVSHVTAELDRSSDWGGPEMSGLSPAAKLARQHTLKTNAEAAAKAKAQQQEDAAVAAAANAANTSASKTFPNGNSAGVPTWEKNTATRQGSVSPVKGGGAVRVNEDGTRVVVEDDDDDRSDDDIYGGSRQAGDNIHAGWDDDEDWDGEDDEDVTIRMGMERVNMDEDLYEEPEPWAQDVRRSAERTRQPSKGILKNADKYDQTVYLGENTVVNRVRSNSYNSHPTQAEAGPLARMPSPDPDHIDGLQRHGSHSSGHGSSPTVPSLPSFSFENSTPTRSSFDSPRDSVDSTSTVSHSHTLAEKSLFSHSNSSAPVLSTLGSTAPTLTHRSATTPSKRLAFANNLSVYDTFPPSMYDRRSEPATWSRLTPALAQRIKEELNSYKMEEMEVHAASRIHTQFFV
ncbi:hypothetical protein K435DRAFT_853944 [Dendrothele bispora CBS 962.96]|uniref:Uncharacterized protein n=1 Tax=Dendrothele bispora (strain CBS 962.96) TaxID=1314807 RepID=A0A4S8MF52_DENBC|nr:hypothetical protein K435DRAFT_853944 [Dendrothele bispora CBS 962.96]